MNVTIKTITGDLQGVYEMHRYNENGQLLQCTLVGGYREDLPKKNRLYDLTISDPDNQVTIQKQGLFTSYNFLIDKDGSNAAVIADNSLIFTVLE